MTHHDQKNQTALITGASSGIGLELAHLFARDGYDVVLVSRRERELNALAEKLSAQYKIRARVIAKDLSNPHTADEVHKELEEALIPIDILVNNAGFGLYGTFLELPIERLTEMMQLNMITLTRLTRLFLPAMVEKHSGKLLNVASTAAFQPGPLMAVYYATKSYVLSFSEALYQELKGTGVTVTVLCPGPTRSGFQAAADMEGVRLLKFPIQDSQTVAKSAYRSLHGGRRLIVTGWLNKIMATLVRFTPRAMVLWCVQQISMRSSHD